MDGLLSMLIGGVVTALTIRFNKEIGKWINFLIDGLLSWAHIYFIMLKRYKKSVIRSYRETKVGYRNLRLDLERNYISLNVCSFISPREKEADEEIQKEKLDVLDVLKEHRHLVILGHPGAGKTTLMQWLLLKYAYGHMKEKLAENLIPIFITLRSLESGQSIDERLPEILKQHRFNGGEGFIRKQMEKGKCLLIFDGMDEIVDDETRKKFAGDICGTYASLYGKSRIIITSRIEEFPVDCFTTSFREREILDLDIEQVHDFVHGILKPEDNPDELIRQIEKSEGLKKFVTNPLMMSLLTFVYQESHRKLPNDRVKVYHKCMQLMMEDRDKSRGIYEYRNQFDSDDKELLLCKLAYDFSLQNKWRFTEKELLDLWKKNRPANLKESDLKKILKEICVANGILKHLSGKELSFLHRTFQEYCTAKEISKRGEAFFEKSQDSGAYTQFSKKEWHEITLFLVGMIADAAYLIKYLSKQSPQLALQCLVYAKRVSDKVIDDVLNQVLNAFKKEHLLEAAGNLVYLGYRYGLKPIERFLSSSLEKNRSGGYKSEKQLWPMIDHVMLALSPQKQMVYVASGAVQWGNEPGPWIPGFWMDIYPVTNADYHTWIGASGINELPRHWETKSIEEPMVPDIMKPLPIVDISLKKAEVYSASLGKILPNKFQWQRVIKDADGTGGLLNEHKKRYLKKNKLKESYDYYCLSTTLATALANALGFASDLVLFSDRDLGRKGESDLAHELALARALARDRAIARDHDIDLDSSSVRDLAHAIGLVFTGDLASALSRVRSSDLSRDLVRALDIARDSDNARDLGFEKVIDQFEVAYNEARNIEKELRKSPRWTESAYEQLVKLGKTLRDTLVIFLEMTEKPIPDDLLKALRQPGLLMPVTEFSPNETGIYDLVGNVWEWTSTTNDKSEHLVCGGAWTEETFDPDKEVWYPPEYRDINLGFRCVCDWDKITEALTPGELGKDEGREKKDSLKKNSRND